MPWSPVSDSFVAVSALAGAASTAATNNAAGQTTLDGYTGDRNMPNIHHV
jgi:hypothetical protein